jgi:hypothetical protein
MDLVEIDIVGAQALQAGVDLVEDGLARQAAAIGAGAHLHIDLGRQHDLLALGEIAQGAADDLLAGAVGVDVGGVDEIDAEFQCLLDERPTLLLIKGPEMGAALRHAIGHAAEADAGNLEASLAEPDVVHECLLR